MCIMLNDPQVANIAEINSLLTIYISALQSLRTSRGCPERPGLWLKAASAYLKQDGGRFEELAISLLIKANEILCGQ
jgi:hypothetical protein